jgi:hypothetical protein
MIIRGQNCRHIGHIAVEQEGREQLLQAYAADGTPIERDG